MGVEIVNLDSLLDGIRNLSIEEQRSAFTSALTQSGFIIARNAQNQMIRGGKQKPVDDKLTSRTGTGRRSIRSDRPEVKKGSSFVEVGTDLKYMSAHETGGIFIKKAHTRVLESGKVVKVKSHPLLLPQRSFLEPGAEASGDEIEAIWIAVWDEAIS